MTGLPLQHFRRSVARYAGTPEAHALLFAGTGITPADLADTGFVLTPELLWHVSDNVRRAYGPGWFLSLPALWSLEVQGQLESAFRFAPNLSAVLPLAVDYGHLQWGVLRWQAEHLPDGGRISVFRNTPIDPDNWQMISLLVSLNFQTILRAAFPAAASQVIVESEGGPPADEAWLAALFGCEVRWNSERCSTFIPSHFLDLASSLADATAFAAAVAGLEKHGEAPLLNISTRLAIVLGDQISGRMTVPDAAVKLRMSKRTLERTLATEGSSFRQLQDEALQRRLKRLMADPDLSLAVIAERLGYSDESALSRATRRWFGATAPQLRRERNSAAD